MSADQQLRQQPNIFEESWSQNWSRNRVLAVFSGVVVNGMPIQRFVDQLDDKCRMLFKITDQKVLIENQRRDIMTRLRRARMHLNNESKPFNNVERPFVSTLRMRLLTVQDLWRVFEKLQEKWVHMVQDDVDDLWDQAGWRYTGADVRIYSAWDMLVEMPLEFRSRNGL